MKRSYKEVALDHFSSNRQMLFFMGPRQVGKTTTCLEVSKEFERSFYFSWDNQQDREHILAGPTHIAQITSLERLGPAPLLIFDEIHKYQHWKEFLKGLYDSYPHKAHILVTGSARLDVYKRGGDSLMGRYFLYRIHPLSVGELLRPSFSTEELHPPARLGDDAFATLWQFGGYPDPYLKANSRFFNRWKRLRFQQLFQEEVRDLTQITELAQLETLANLLKTQAGSQSSYESLARLVRVTGNTIRRWTNILSSLYFSFEVRPWSTNITRSLLKEPKFYLWDWSELADPGARAENFVALHLLKAVHFWTDSGLGNYSLHYLRDKSQREVDFLIAKEDKPWMLVEVKYRDQQGISPSLIYFQKESGAPYAFQVIIDLPYVDQDCFQTKTPLIVPAKTFLSQLI